MEVLRSVRTPNFKISIHGSESPLGLALVLICCALLPTEVLLTCGVTLALLQLVGQISHKPKKTPSKLTTNWKLPPGLQPPEPYLHSSSQRPIRPRVAPNRAHPAPRVPRPPPQPRPVRVCPEDATETEAGMIAALEAYEAVAGETPLEVHKESLPLAPSPDTVLHCLTSNLLGHAAIPGGVASQVKEVLMASLPQIRIFNFSRTRGADGIVLPALEVVIFMQSDVVSSACLQERLQRGMRGARNSSGDLLSGMKLQKSVLRHCLSLLVDKGFKFRRSAFKAEAPTVLLLAPAEFSHGEAHVSVELSVNNPFPLLNAALVHEASIVDKRAFALISSVQRWADARGLAHISFGPLNSYAWAHMAIFYLQTRASHRMPRLVGRSPPPGLGPDSVPDPPPINVALLEGFFEFLGEECLWKSLSVHLRGRPPQGDEVLICDAFRTYVDLGVELRTQENAISRIRAEAARALKLFSTPGTVADLLAKPDFRGLPSESGDRWIPCVDQETTACT
eukprot:gnl/MRDRNA2_/MRDRNA2_111380_c0_seq1.p1 gnl/MRDRNA2_/MRDRNA2_111380_c0~~gnl/MRDRNA2_/MRDRNA2_111380_c0_seq1.p1  ORF type:complete len:508 (+),score=66.61 gnl/MRDRNA2_/MRDRNA2_111380_c0_seq1:179-1702(+)